jgi:2-hydroxy-3-oxopropionate reductase
MPQRIAIIGASIMGGAIATRLLACGHAVFVFDPDAQGCGAGG